MDTELWGCGGWELPAGKKAGCLVARVLDEDDLIGNWTLVGEELEQLSGRRGATKLGFALLLRLHSVFGRFPNGREIGTADHRAGAAAGRAGADRTDLRPDPG
ncbi:hypothetical protein [Nonomuraea sp. JJY05]|uniref:hypothetical protein n=1 Tax=Nonomuraea sp. JJY05 TaxID=3350255 RepID=UPI00373E2D31